MSVFNISSFLGKFKKFEAADSAKRDAIIKALHDVCGISCAPEDIAFKDSFVWIRTSAPARAEIAIKKEALMKALEGTAAAGIKEIR